MYSLGLGGVGGLGLPGVPFTFPTVLFVSLANDIGNGMSWGDADRVWSLYSEGSRSGAISSPGWSVSSLDYLKGRGVSEDLAIRWLQTADAAAGKWWGQGSYFRDFGGSPGVLGAAEGVVQGAAEVVQGVVGGVTGGIARAMGIPKWILAALVVVVVALVLLVYVRPFLPRALRAR